MDSEKLKRILQKIDEINAQDPNRELHEGTEIPKELLYGRRMTEMLLRYWPEASQELQIAVRAQHIARFEVPRSSFPEGRTGYLKWRSHLYKFHADKIAAIMESLSCDPRSIDRVCYLVQKKGLKKDPETMILEGVACLVFLQYYYVGFVKKYSDEKVIEILQKTWKRMGTEAQGIALRDIHLDGRPGELLKKALS